jgi:hypothetical protein
MNADLDDPIMSGFVQRLDEINALADGSEGFVWRFQAGAEGATYLRPFDDQRILLNMSVWATLGDLKRYVYRTKHVDLMKSKADWFTKLGDAHLALWWIQKGHVSSVSVSLEISFAETPAFRWLQSHANGFGFYLSFPKGNTCGYQYEPWHWCYRGS